MALSPPLQQATFLTDLRWATLDRLGDMDSAIWSSDEIDSYVKDAYDLFTTKTHCIYDRLVVPNAPAFGNWHSDITRYVAGQKAGAWIQDNPLSSSGIEYRGPEKQVGGPYSEPYQATQPYRVEDTDPLSHYTWGGRLPDLVVEVVAVYYNYRPLTGVSSEEMRQLSSYYERITGDPQFFVLDKDGPFSLRVAPKPSGTAAYYETSGFVGQIRSTDDTDVTVKIEQPSGFGVLRKRTDCFPALSTWGTIRRIHPEPANLVVACYRRGRDLSSYPSELPPAFNKYLVYWAMSRALRRAGDGQDLKLSEHFASRFAMGVDKMTKKVADLATEQVGRFGRQVVQGFGIGPPMPPANWGTPRYYRS